MSGSGTRSAALERLGADVFKDQRFDAFKTDVGIVTARWLEEKPMIFKTDVHQAHGSKSRRTLDGVGQGVCLVQ